MPHEFFPAVCLWISPDGAKACIAATDGATYLVHRERHPYHGETFPDVWTLPWEPRAGELCEFAIEFHGVGRYAVTCLQPLMENCNQDDAEALYSHYQKFVRDKREIQKTRRQNRRRELLERYGEDKSAAAELGVRTRIYSPR